jgi:hypothetical protein
VSAVYTVTPTAALHLLSSSCGPLPIAEVWRWHAPSRSSPSACSQVACSPLELQMSADHLMADPRSSSAKPSLVDNVKRPMTVTECWVEACCFEQKLLSTTKHLVFQPLPASMPISGTKTFNIHLSGYSSDQVTYLRRLVRVIGATNVASMNRLTTHLVTNRREGPKVEKAREWGIVIVGEEWLLEMGRTGQVALTEPFRVKPVVGSASGQESRSLAGESCGTGAQTLYFVAAVIGRDDGVVERN